MIRPIICPGITPAAEEHEGWRVFLQFRGLHNLDGILFHKPVINNGNVNFPFIQNAMEFINPSHTHELSSGHTLVYHVRDDLHVVIVRTEYQHITRSRLYFGQATFHRSHS